jgi:hypothetical protein
MPIHFCCPQCYKPLSIGTRKAGTAVVCPLCRSEVAVPYASDYVRPRSPVEAAERPPQDITAAGLCRVTTPLTEPDPAPNSITDFSVPLTSVAPPAPAAVGGDASAPPNLVASIPGAALVAALVLLLLVPALVSGLFLL